MSGIEQSGRGGRILEVDQVVRRQLGAAIRKRPVPMLSRELLDGCLALQSLRPRLYLVKARQTLSEAAEATEDLLHSLLAVPRLLRSRIPDRLRQTLLARLHLEMNSTISRSSTAQKTPTEAGRKALQNIFSTNSRSLLFVWVFGWQHTHTTHQYVRSCIRAIPLCRYAVTLFPCNCISPWNYCCACSILWWTRYCSNPSSRFCNSSRALRPTSPPPGPYPTWNSA